MWCGCLRKLVVDSHVNIVIRRRRDWSGDEDILLCRSSSTPHPRTTDPIRVPGLPQSPHNSPHLRANKLSERGGDFACTGHLSGWILSLQEAIECGDKRVGDVVSLQAHEGTESEATACTHLTGAFEKEGEVGTEQ